MASLYEINQRIMECVDPETGELIDPESLEALVMEKELKIENVALWIKNLQSDALAYKAEKEAFAKREAAANAKAESLKGWLAMALAGQKFSSTRCAVSFRKSEKVEVDDVDSLPAELKTQKVTFDPDKKAIKALLKEGKEVSGCRLIESLNTHIK